MEEIKKERTDNQSCRYNVYFEPPFIFLIYCFSFKPIITQSLIFLQLLFSSDYKNSGSAECNFCFVLYWFCFLCLSYLAPLMGSSVMHLIIVPTINLASRARCFLRRDGIKTRAETKKP